jgi:hypothetical protein
MIIYRVERDDPEEDESIEPEVRGQGRSFPLSGQVGTPSLKSGAHHAAQNWPGFAPTLLASRVTAASDSRQLDVAMTQSAICGME